MEIYTTILVVIAVLFIAAIVRKKQQNKGDGEDNKVAPTPELPPIPDITPTKWGDVNNGERFFSMSVEGFRNPAPIISKIQLLSTGNVLITSQAHSEVKTYIARSKWVYGDFPDGVDASMYSFTGVVVPKFVNIDKFSEGPTMGLMDSSPVWTLEGNSYNMRTGSCDIYVHIKSPEGFTDGTIIVTLLFEDLR